MAIHKAECAPQFSEHFLSTCVHCGSEIRRVPGGQGPTWVHSATGAVAGPGPGPAQSDRYGICGACHRPITAEEHRSIEADIDFVEHHGHTISRPRCDHCSSLVRLATGLYSGAYRHDSDEGNLTATFCETDDGYIRVTVNGAHNVKETTRA